MSLKGLLIVLIALENPKPIIFLKQNCHQFHSLHTVFENISERIENCKKKKSRNNVPKVQIKQNSPWSIQKK